MEKQEKPDVTKPVDVKVAENPDNLPSKEVVSEKAEEAPAAAAEESPVVTPASEETSEVSPTVTGTEVHSATENSSEAPEESSDSTENSGDQEAVEETPEIKVNLHIQLSEIIFFCWLPKGTCLIFIFLDFFYMFNLFTDILFLCPD